MTFTRAYAVCLTLCFSALLLLLPKQLYPQSGNQGTVAVTVQDASGAVIQKAKLELVEEKSNSPRLAVTDSKGVYSFVNLNIGQYKLTISRNGYETKVYPDVLVQSSTTTTLNVSLPVGAASDTVTVAGGTTPLIEASSNVIGTIIDLKQIEDLPLSGRNLTSLAALVPGFAGNPGSSPPTGSFNGQGLTSQGSNIDGVTGSPARGKYSGNLQPAVQPRIEDIEQMSIVTDQLDLNSGFGQATSQLNFVSRSGSNRFHGRAFYNFRNSALFANSWADDVAKVKKPSNKYSDFGFSIGGPILRNKLFFFGTFASLRKPGSFPATNTFMTTAAQAGTFTYSGHTVNILDLAHQQNPALTSSINSDISAQLSVISNAIQSGATTAVADPNLALVHWNTPQPTTNYYPAARIDYNLSSKARMNLAWLMTKSSQPNYTAPFGPGSGLGNTGVNYNGKSYTANYGFDYIFSSKLLNQFKAGFLYNSSGYSTADLYATSPDVVWAYGDSGQNYRTPSGHYYPLFNGSDAMTWQHRGHTVQYGASWYREQDHYYNNAVGFTQYTVGLNGGDSQVFNAINDTTLPGATLTQLTQARDLYTTLTGRLTSASGQTAYSHQTGAYTTPGQTTAYNLDELMSSSGIFAQDSWKVLPNLTLNYGLRWDFVGDDHDLTGAYHSSDVTSIYGPTPVGALFQPGNLGGNQNPSYTTQPIAYNPWKVTPQPAFGFVWSPRVSGGWLKAVLGGDTTVIRGGYALRRYTEPQQFFWDNATSFGSFFYQTFSSTANAAGGAGTFTPGTKSLGDTITNYAFTPSVYMATESQSDFTFNSSAPPITGIDRNIKQPYVQSWNLGIQRSLGHNLALEIRYNGNRSLHQWIAIDPNEVNMFENGFLAEFKNAQANLAASGGTSFSSSYGHKTPIMDQAFGGANGAGYQDPTIIQNIQTGQAGNVAQILAGAYWDNSTYFCNLVGANFKPCANNLGLAGGGAYPINFFQANPYAAGNTTSYLTAAGYSNYNGLQVDLRQGSWHGFQYDANYTYSKSLGVNSKADYAAGFNGYTLRDLRRSYVPSQFDLRHVFHANGTFDLPFGKGRAFLNRGGVVDGVLGHWDIGTIITYQTGAPFTLAGGNYTYNDYGDGGVTLTGVTASQLQKAVGVYRIPNQTSVAILDPKYLSSPTGGQSNPAYINPNTTPGTIDQIIVLHGPHAYNQDLSLSKAIPLFDKIDFRLQGEFLNVWNHPTFGNTSGSVDSGIQDSAFSQSSQTNTNRVIEIRANIEF